MWEQSEQGVSGYGDVPTFAQAPSLYQTAWSLLLLRAADRSALRINRAVVISELQSVYDQPAQARVDATGLNQMNQLYLATRALSTMGVRPDGRLAQAVEDLRVGGQYRSDSASQPSWAWTYVAVETLSAARMPVPNVVRTSLEDALPSARSANGVAALIATGIPVVGSLATVEPAAAMRRDRPLSAEMLRSWQLLILRSAPSGPGVGLLLALQKIALAEGLQFGDVPAGWLKALQAKDGGYALGTGESRSDVQVTYDAVALGAPFSELARATAALDEMPQGWITTIARPTVLSTFDAVYADSLCGLVPRQQAMRRQISAWLTGVNKMSADDMGRLCWMAKTYHVGISMTQRQVMASAFGSAMQADFNSPYAAPLVGGVIEDEASCYINLVRPAQIQAHAYLASAPLSTVFAAFGLASAARTLDDSTDLARAKTEVSQLRVGPGYRASLAAQGPDLISTSYGYEISGMPSIAYRLRILSDYRTVWGPALLPTSGADGAAANQPTVDLASLTYGLMLATGTAPTVPLI